MWKVEATDRFWQWLKMQDEALRVQSNGCPIRGFFVFDPHRKAIVLCAGNKAGKNEKRFYKEMLNLAEHEYQLHLNSLKKSHHENVK